MWCTLTSLESCNKLYFCTVVHSQHQICHFRETCKTGHDPSPKLELLAWLRENFLIKTLKRRLLAGDFALRIAEGVSMEVWSEIEGESTENGGKYSLCELAVFPVCVNKEHSWSRRPDGSENASGSVQWTPRRFMLVVGRMSFFFHRSVLNSWNSQLIWFIFRGIAARISAKWSRDR